MLKYYIILIVIHGWRYIMGMALQYILPIFFVMLSGIFARRFLGFTTDHSRLLVKYVMGVAIPCDILVTFSHYSIDDLLKHFNFLAVFSIVTLIVFFAGFLYARLFKKMEKIETFFFAGTSCLSNACMLAFPILIYIMGSIGAIYGLLSVIVLIIGLQVISFLANRSNAGNCDEARDKLIKEVLKSIKEPFFIALILGLILSSVKYIFHVSIPSTVHQTLDYFAVTTAPVALFAVGINIDLKSLKKHLRGVVEASIFKLILMPVVAWYTAKFFNLPPEATIALMICSVIATAKCLYGVAQQKNIYAEPAAAIVASTTMLTMVSLSVIITVLSIHYPDYFAHISSHLSSKIAD